MPLSTARACPLCGSHARVPYAPLNAHHLVRCDACAMVFSSMEPTAEELEAYYDHYPVVSDISEVTLRRYDELLDMLEPYRRSGRLIDVGCGSGLFVQQAIKRGWDAQGTEYPGPGLNICRTRGLPVIEGPLNPANYPPGHFDVVCSFEVIEHVTDPRTDLERMKTILRPGGALYVTTPNFNCLARRLSPSTWNIANYPEHLNYFTARTLHRMLSANGSGKRWLTTTGFSIYRWQVDHDDSVEDKKAALQTQESVRRALDNNAFLRVVKRVTNHVLNFFKLGDSMKALYEKPAIAEIGMKSATKLRFNRKKPQHAPLSLQYRLAKLPFATANGKLRFLLDQSWIASRLAMEQAERMYGFGPLSMRRKNLDFLLSHLRTGSRVLDLGCKYGDISSLAATKAAHVIAVDQDERALEQARTRYKVDNIEFIHADAFEVLRTRAEPVDTVILSHIIEHLEDPGELLRELHGHAQSCYIETPDLDASYLNHYRILSGAKLQYTDNDHIWEFDREALCALIEAAGWRITDSEYRYGVQKYWCERA